VPATAQNIVAIAAGLTHNAMLHSDGRVTVWGGTNGAPLTLSPSNVIAVAVGGNFTVTLQNNGLARLWAKNDFGHNQIAAVTNVIAIAAHEVFGMALRADGTLAPWLGSVLDSNFVAIAAGGRHRLALTSENILVGWGDNYFGQLEMPAVATNLVAFAAGGAHSLALRSDGNLVAWGANFSGQIDVSTVAGEIVAISAGDSHNLALAKQTGLPPFAIQQPQSAMLGESVLLVAPVQAASATQFQWQLNGENLAGATNATLVLTHLHWTNSGNYQVIISNALGVTTGSSVALTVTRTPLVFATNGEFAPSYTNEFRARLLGASGTGPVVIYASTNLLDWAPIYTNPPVIGSVDFADVQAEAAPQRFYRAAEDTVAIPMENAANTNETVLPLARP
jgi:hypothetical protein